MNEANKRINMKTCIDCNLDKEFTEFRKRKSSKDGFRNQCKKCLSIKSRKWRKENQYKILENRKKDYEKNKERYKRKSKEWDQENIEQKKERDRKYHIKNKDLITKRAKQWYLDNKEYASFRNKKYYEKNKKRYLLWGKDYYEKNKVKIKKYSKEYDKERKKTDPLFKMKCNLRSRTSNAFKSKGYKKSSKTQDMLGVDWEVCKAHIEIQFKKGMKWSNHGEWQIDHIIPLASAKNEKDLKKLCHYRNLQPLWAFDNMSKSDKIIGQQSFMRI